MKLNTKPMRIVVSLLAALIVLLTLTLLPCLPVLEVERELNDELKVWASTSRLETMPDYDIRAALQRLARTQKLHLPWENTNIQYDDRGQIRGVGYTLPLELPIMYFGLTKWVAVRFVSLPEKKGSQ